MHFKGKTLTKIKDKSGGKNQSTIDGFYQDETGKQYFIKQPNDKKELFTELFAGLLLKAFMEQELIEPIYHPSLICADVIEVDKGNYALIQDVAVFQELFKFINTGNRSQSDRDPLIEMLLGPSYYPSLTKTGEYFGLSTALMFSLLLGANSVHSGNIVILHNDEPSSAKQFARLDWGDAFRYFCFNENNDNILWPREYQGIINFKGFTKGYFFNYKKIPGLFPAIAEKGRAFNTKLAQKQISFKTTVESVLSQLPKDLLDNVTQIELAEYLGSKTLVASTFGEEGNFGLFAQEIAVVLEERLKQILLLNNLVEVSQSEISLYHSIIEHKPNNLTLGEALAFPDILQEWAGILDNYKVVDFSNINLDLLIEKFNFYVDSIAQQSDLVNLWSPLSNNQQNLFTPYHQADLTEQRFGFAFVPECRESTILKMVFKIIGKNFGSNRPTLYENASKQYKKAFPDKPWALLDNLFTNAFNVIVVLNNIKQTDPLLDSDESIETQKDGLNYFLNEFTKARKATDEMLHKHTLIESNPLIVSYYYSISDDRLEEMSGDQLVTICLEEINHPNLSPLLERILTNQELWRKVKAAFYIGDFSKRPDNPIEKMSFLNILRKQLQSHKTKLLHQQVTIKQLEDSRNNALDNVRLLEQKLDDRDNQIEHIQDEVEQLKAQHLEAQNKMPTQLEPEHDILANTVHAQNRRKEQIAQLLFIAGNIESLATLEFNKQSQKYAHAMALVQDIRKKTSDYVQQSDYEAGTLQSDLSDIISEHKETLENHSGMKHLLGNLILAILLLGAGYLIASATNRVLTGSFTFFHEPNCRREIAQLENSLSNFTKQS